MKAFYINEPGSTTIRDILQPAPGPGEVLLQTRFIGMCGTDLSTFRGKNPLVSYPRIPGHEISATIIELGSDVPDRFQLGTNVTVYPNTNCGTCASCKRGRTNACRFNQTLGVQRDGALRNFFTVPWQKLYRADELSLQELAFVEPLAVGFHAVERGRVTPSDTVAVIGCGMVGLGALAGAARRGAVTIALDLDDQKLALSRQTGAQHTVNSSNADAHEQLLELTNGLGPDVVIEAVGTPETYRNALEEVAYTGRVVYIGWVKDPVALETKIIVHKELDIIGSRNSLFEFPAVIEMLSEHKFPVAECISTTVNMDDAGTALDQWATSPQMFTKIMVEVTA
jgi:threonine dehydrogenase-like Zn-dependent dehydrogenase